MSVSQLDAIVKQVNLLPPEALVQLIKRAAELLEQKQVVGASPKTNYAALFGSGKGMFATAEEADRFVREERDAWER